MRRARLIPLLVLALAALAPAARAANPFYLTAKLGNTAADVSLGRFSQLVDGDDNSSSFGLGLNLGRHVAIQAEYHDLGRVPGIGSPCTSQDDACPEIAIPIEADTRAISVTALPHLKLTRRLRLYGKLGFISWDSDVSAVRDAGSRFIEEFSDEDLVYGGGLRVRLPGPLGVYAEYERIADSFETAAVGVTYGF